jgi:hypothetical protein
MTVYKKLMQARLKIIETEIKKGGRNEFAKFNYFELPDFLPLALQIFDDLGLCGIVSFSSEVATLTICDSEKPEDRIVIESPMSTASLKGVHEVQNLGAVQTYLRRYLWVAALELTEHDQLDASIGAPETARGAHQASRTRQRPAAQRPPSAAPQAQQTAQPSSRPAPAAGSQDWTPDILHRKLVESGLTGYGTKTLLAICRVSTIQEIPLKAVSAIKDSSQAEGGLQALVEKYNQGMNSQGSAILPPPVASEEAIGSDTENPSMEELKERAARAFE